MLPTFRDVRMRAVRFNSVHDADMNDTNITCPKCGAEFPLSEAVSHRLRDQLKADFEKERGQLNEALASRERKLNEEQATLAIRQKDLAAELARQLEGERRKLTAEVARQAEDKLGTQLADLQAQLGEQQAKLRQAQEAELSLRRQQRELEDAKNNLELEVARKLDAERHKIADVARQQGADSERLKVADKDNIIKGLQEQIGALQQRAEQGSMQLQGETLELELEGRLRAAFAFDEITEIKKGQRGADATQRVRTPSGFDCGVILWEAKRARNWSADWPEKLKSDQREANAELAVIVTTCPPEGLNGLAQVDGVWVCEPAFILPLAAALRQGLINTASQRVQHSNRADKMSALYEYLCGIEFRQHIEAIVESFVGLKDQLDAEKRALARQWKEREQQIEKAITHTAMLYGGIQGIAGRQALPEIRTLQLPGDLPAPRGAE